MNALQQRTRSLRLALWIAQVVLALLLLSGAIMKWMPIERISAMMPWTCELPKMTVRLLGIVDLLGAVGLVLPAALRWKWQWTFCAAVGVGLLMVSAIVFHVGRDEAEVIGVNVFGLAVAVFVAWGRFGKMR